MAVAGTLEIQMMAGIARLQSDMTQAKSVVGSAMSDISRSVQAAKTVLGGLGLGLGIGAMIALGKSVIDATARFKDLGQEAGTSASALSKFEAPARMAGLGLESVSSAMFKMSKAALEAKDPTSKAAQALNAIGISTSQLKGLKPDEMFELVARSISKYGDGLEKNAVMQELFGKSGREMNRVVAEIAATGQLAATVTDAEAEAADRFGDQLVELKMHSERFWRSLVSEGLPAMNDIIRSFIDAKREGGLLQGVIAALSDTFTKMAGSQLDQVNKQIEIARKAQERIAGRSDLENSLFTSKEQIELANSLNALLLKRDQIMKGIHSDELIAQNRRAMEGQRAKADINYNPAARAASEAAEKKAAAEESRRLAEALKNELAVSIMLAEWAKKNEAANQEIADSYTKRFQDANKVIAQIEFETSLLKLSNNEREITIASRALETSGLQKGSAAYEHFANQLRAAITAQQGVRAEIEATTRATEASLKAQADSARAWEDLADRVIRGFRDMRSALKAFLQDMIALFAKKWFLQIVAGITGSSVLGAAAGQVGQGTITGMIGNSAMSWLGSTAIGAAGSYFASGVAGSMVGSAAGMGATVAGSATGIGAMTGGAGAMGSSLGAAISAIPVWGWIAMAVIAAVLYFSGKGGGPKVEGGASNFPGGESLFGNISGGQANSQMQGLVDATSRGFTDALTNLSGTGAATFGFKLSTDPAGTAPNVVDAVVRNAAGEVILHWVKEIGRDDKDIGPALQEATQRAMLAALQSSDLPGAIADIFKGIDANTASAEEISNAFAAANAEQQRFAAQWSQFEQMFNTGAENLAEAHKIVDDGFKALGISVPESSSAFAELVRGIDTSTTEGRKLFDSLMKLAPAFKFVEDSADALFASFQSAASSINPAFGQKLARAKLEDAAKAWGAVAGGGFSVQQIIDFVGGGGSPDEAWAVAQRLGGNAPQLITDLYTAYAAWQSVTGDSTTSLEDFASATGSAVDAAIDLSRALEDARAGLRSYLDSLLLSDLSPLDPAAKLAEAKKQYEMTLGLAQGGDIGAINRLSQDADVYLRLAREFSASSSDYVDVFNAVFAALRGVAGTDPQREIVDNGRQQVTQLGRIKEVLIEIRDRNDLNTEAIIETTEINRPEPAEPPRR